MKFKDDVVASGFDYMAPRAQELAIEMDQWSQTNYGIELTLTATISTKEEDRKLGRVSDTHRTGRAFDMRTRDLPESLIAEFCAHFRKKYPKLGALVSGQYQLIVYRPHGTGPHLHIQLKREHSRGVTNGTKEIKTPQVSQRESGSSSGNSTPTGGKSV